MMNVIRCTGEFLAHRLGLSRLPYFLYRIIRGRHIMVVFAYHRVVDGRATKSFYTDYDRGMDVTVFSHQLDSLRKHFHVAGLHEFIDLVSGQSPLRRHTAIVTFDDADSDFIRYALPELKRRKMPAVMMAQTDMVGSSVQLWHVRVSNVVRFTSQDQWQEIRRRADEWPKPVAAVVRRTKDIGPKEDRRPLARAVNFALDEVSHDEVDQMVAAWEQIVPPSESLPIYCMDWNQLKELEQNGIAVESHTQTHRKLPMLSDDEIRRELVNSKAILEEKLGKQVTAIAYPQGRYESRVGQAARAAGYCIGFTTVRTPCNYPLEGLDRFAIPRWNVYGETRPHLDLYFARIGVQCLLRTRPW